MRMKLSETLFRIFLCAWGIGLGARFTTAYLRRETYIPNLFDSLFDWGTLFTLNTIFLAYTLHPFYKERKRMENERN